MSFKIKELEWREVIGMESNAWYAETPAAHYGDGITIFYTQGKYWPYWDCGIPGQKTLKEAKSFGQEFHNNYIKQFLASE